jgi:hypothetical protein
MASEERRQEMVSARLELEPQGRAIVRLDWNREYRMSARGRGQMM